MNTLETSKHSYVPAALELVREEVDNEVRRIADKKAYWVLARQVNFQKVSEPLNMRTGFAIMKSRCKGKE